MLKISLDEGYVFDILSISQVKIIKSSNENKQKLVHNYQELSKEIINQIGLDLYSDIVASKEYQELRDANEKTFDLVDQVKNDKGLAKLVDDSNYSRYQKKVALQNKFFNNEVKEVKIGY
jgi:hypothetical protein